MSVAKKILPIFEDQINAKIQRKFDLVFIEKSAKSANFSNGNNEIRLGNPQNFDVEEMVMERNDGSNKNNKTKQVINLDFDNNEKGSVIPKENSRSNTTLGRDNKQELPLDFDFNFGKNESKGKNEVPVASDEEEYGGFTLDDSDIGDNDSNENRTQKTMLFTPSMLTKPHVEMPSLDKSNSNIMSIDVMSTEETKANIETTIKEILRPDLEATMFNLSSDRTDVNDIEDSILDLGNTPSKSFSLSEIDDGTFILDGSDSLKKVDEITDHETHEFDSDNSYEARADATMDFDLGALTALANDETRKENENIDVSTKMDELDFGDAPITSPSMPKGEAAASIEESGYTGNGLNTEDSMRFQSTIRALREEREEMLLHIKNLKGDSKELEQDNLTLKANLDEAKIEITILRKRHMVEIEDLKYRVGLSEEKKAMAEEKSKQADMRREKLEQKVRIDFNQIKQREKELESKLELLSMDVDSQVQSRDQKILELRRKIDALEFNMENASIKEQRTLDDKRKLEDRLNKIMKTLRHSIKNLEDDIDHVEDESGHQKGKN